MKRLKAIVEFINEDEIIADVGCDHGYLIKLAITNKNIKKAYAIDNKIGPLNSAKDNLKGFNEINFLLSDGLTKVDAKDITTVVIAGMGGMLINKIFLDSIDKFETINKVIVCPNKNIDKVRETFTNHGFKINRETVVYEDKIYYEVIEFIKGKQNLTSKELMFGPILLKTHTQDFINKWTNYKERINKIDAKQEELKLIEEVLKNEN